MKLIIITLLVITGLVFAILKMRKNSEDIIVDTRPNIEEITKFIPDLISILMDDRDTTINQDLIKAYTDPTSYVSNNSQVYMDYGIESASSNDYKDVSLIALFQELEKKKLGWGFDWNEFPDKTLGGINFMLESNSIETISIDDMESHLQSGTETINILKLCNSETNKLGYGLLELGRGNDAYEVLLVKSENIQEVLEISKKLDFNFRRIENVKAEL